MRRYCLATTVVAIAAVVVACTSGPVTLSGPVSETADSHGMSGYLDGLVEVRQFRGAVEVPRGDEVLLSKGFGQADVVRDVLNEPDTRHLERGRPGARQGLGALHLPYRSPRR